MIPAMDNARKMLQTVKGRPMPTMPGLKPPTAPTAPASINATPGPVSAVAPAGPAGEVPGKPAVSGLQLNPSAGAPVGGMAPSAGGMAPPTAPAVPSTSMPGSLSPAPAAPPAAPPVPPTVPGASSYANVNTINPSADLRSQSITPGATADRVGMAKGAFDDYLTQKLPEFQAQLRKTYQGNAALGRLGSGMLRTDVGNLDLAANRDANLTQSALLRDATDKSITDQSNYRNELRGERGYQNELENQAFTRGRQQVLDADALQNSAFGRDATRTALGFANDPTSLLAAIAAARSGQAAQGAAGVGGLAQSSSYLDILRQMLAGQNPSLKGGNTPDVPGAGVDTATLAKILQGAS